MKAIGIKFFKYLPWALIQQLFVIFIFTTALKNISFFEALGWTVGIFSFLHIPNLFLMGLTFFVEGIFLYFYTSLYSLIWIVPLHALLAILISTYVPETITHGMRVLWNYWREK